MYYSVLNKLKNKKFFIFLSIFIKYEEILHFNFKKLLKTSKRHYINIFVSAVVFF